VVERSGLSFEDKLPGSDQTLADALLTPTRIYAKPIKALIGEVAVKSLAHITGGGLVDNMHRTLPDRLGVELQAGWPVPEVFRWIAEAGPVAPEEMLRTFNMGIGMTAVVSRADVDRAIALLKENDIAAQQIGEVVEHEPNTPRVIIEGDV
jgi:phosphoribosylformylglycinamidine cyclo-ligase